MREPRHHSDHRINHTSNPPRLPAAANSNFTNPESVVNPLRLVDLHPWWPVVLSKVNSAAMQCALGDCDLRIFCSLIDNLLQAWVWPVAPHSTHSTATPHTQPHHTHTATPHAHHMHTYHTDNANTCTPTIDTTRTHTATHSHQPTNIDCSLGLAVQGSTLSLCKLSVMSIM